LIITVKSVSTGNFEKIPRGGELCVNFECGEFHCRTSYMKHQGNKTNINERLIIDLDNDSQQSINVNVNVIQKNDLDQSEKDKIEYETIGSAE
jgi:hypothetical protein